jgi:large subunit ribosomal protein L33
MANSKREIIKMESTGGTGHFFVTKKNKTNTPDKLERMHYDPFLRKRVKYVEKKLK